jgi:hypothetical protein
MPTIIAHLQSNSGRAYSIKGDDRNPTRPVALVGRIQPTPTKGRPNPPQPISGFVCASTPFDLGHIMALELGGPDVTENIVPQYRHWQETGRWRQMEVALAKEPKAAGSIFVAALGYTPHPDTYSAQQQRFYNELAIFDWTDRRIPDYFDIWFIDRDDPLATKINTDLLTKASSLSKFDGLLAMVSMRATSVPRWDHTRMPSEDVEYWKDRQIRQAVELSFDEYNQQRQTQVQSMQTLLLSNPSFSPHERAAVADVTRSPRRDEIDYTWDFMDEIKGNLQSDYGWTAIETTAISGERILTATFGHRTQAQEKGRQERHAKYLKDYSSKKKLHASFKSRGANYTAKGWKGSYRDYIVKVNGKIKSHFVATSGVTEAVVINTAKALSQVAPLLAGKTVTATVRKELQKKDSTKKYFVDIKAM